MRATPPPPPPPPGPPDPPEFSPEDQGESFGYSGSSEQDSGSSKTPIKPGQKAKRKRRDRPFGVLVVDDEPAIRAALGDALDSENMRLHEAGCLEEARRVVEDRAIDLVLLDVKLPDGSGLELAEELADSQPGVQSIVMTGLPNLERAVEAIRAGACDFIAKPLDLTELNHSVARAMEKRRTDTKLQDRVTRLKRICKKLNKSRYEVTQQVDILCNDLVTAYQELADQMKHMQVTNQFRAMIEQDLDLENILRTCLEQVLNQVGPTNAVVFLPSQSGGFTMGGYVNYSFDKPTADILLSHLCDVAAPRIAEAYETKHLTENEEISGWLLDDSAWLTDMHVVAIPCRHEDECLAGILLFRDSSEPFDTDGVETMAAVSKVFAEHLVKVIDVHHRHVEDFDDWDDDDDDGDAYVPF